jgi:hypothetical protein
MINEFDEVKLAYVPKLVNPVLYELKFTVNENAAGKRFREQLIPHFPQFISATFIQWLQKHNL